MMQIVFVLLVMLLFLTIISMLGYMFNNCIKMQRGNHLFIGFFLYFALFEIVALPMIILQSPLHMLCTVWRIVCVVIVGAFLTLAIRKKIVLSKKSITTNNWLFWAMLTLALLQILFVCMQKNNSWDTAFYIGNVVDAIQTDSMYLYDGYTGWIENVVNIKYAICTFYMHDAAIGYIFGIHGAIVCRFFNTILCQIFSIYVVYLLGMEIWKKKTEAYAMVCFWIVTNFGVSTGYFANDFLLSRSYEAKAFCANIVLPAVLLLLLRLVRKQNENSCFIILFIVNIASVAISSSCLMLVPLLEGIFFLIILMLYRNWHLIWKMIVCILPSGAYLILYLLNHLKILQIMIH